MYHKRGNFWIKGENIYYKKNKKGRMVLYEKVYKVIEKNSIYCNNHIC